jgi:hypothetical protein
MRVVPPKVEVLSAQTQSTGTYNAAGDDESSRNQVKSAPIKEALFFLGQLYGDRRSRNQRFNQPDYLPGVHSGSSRFGQFTSSRDSNIGVANIAASAGFCPIRFSSRSILLL